MQWHLTALLLLALASQTATLAAPLVASDGVAEAHLIEIYRLTGAGRTKEALGKAERLVRELPNFQLAQLVYGDLLAARGRPVKNFGDVPASQNGPMASALNELRDESQMRIKALRERPPAGTIPSQFLSLSPRNKHAIAVDASRARLYLFENSPQGLSLVADYYISVGKSGIEKMVEGDLRTPVGVYFITNNLDPKSLSNFYGSGALPINYPNVLDSRRGKTGRGIWLHGTPPNQFSRAPQATDGCVVMANPDLERVIRTVEIRTTPVVISPKLDWVHPQTAQAESKKFEAALLAWRSAKSSGNIDHVLRFYTPDFKSYSKTLAEWTPDLRIEIDKARGRTIQLKDLSYLRWSDSADTMVVTFGEVADGTSEGPTKRQYWVKDGSDWKIFFEGIIA